MKYPAQYMHSDSLVLDTRPKYKGVTVPPRRDSIWERPPLVIPKMETFRKKAEASLVIKSIGTLC